MISAIFKLGNIIRVGLSGWHYWVLIYLVLDQNLIMYILVMCQGTRKPENPMDKPDILGHPNPTRTRPEPEGSIPEPDPKPDIQNPKTQDIFRVSKI